MQLVLASSSPYRRALLQRLALPFAWASPEVDETVLVGESAQTLTQRLALSKARALRERYPDALIIGSDQACEHGQTIIGKPGNFENARTQLLACSGHWVTFHTALTLYNSATDTAHSTHDLYRVQFRPLEESEICAYLRYEMPYDCAGSFKAEGLGISLFQAMEGNDFHSLIGLPLISLCSLLRKAGLNPLTAGNPGLP